MMKTTAKTKTRKFRPSLHIHILITWIENDTARSEHIFSGSELSGIRHLIKAVERANQVGGKITIVPGYAYPEKWMCLAPVVR